MAIFELSVILIALTFLLVLHKIDKNAFKKYVFIFIGVLLFEYFTQALWLNVNLEKWAYLYLDVSWVITLGWTTIIFVCIKIVDLYLPRDSERDRFFLYLVPITIIGIVAEAVVLYLGIRQYSPAVKDILSGQTIMGIVPVEAIYYIPVFVIMVLSFERYWEMQFKDSPVIPINTRGSKKRMKK